jgi:anti-sigma B factor antagonist
MNNNIRIRMIGSQSDVALIKIRGFLDTVSAYHLQQKCDDLIKKGTYKYIIDCEYLDYISSAGIETFHSMAQRLQKHNGEIIFTNVSAKIHKLFKLIGTTTFFQVKNTVQEAAKELESHEQ